MVELSEMQINHISFNTKQDTFVIATDCAFRVFSTNPYQLLLQKTFQGGFRLAQLIEGTTLILLVPTGVNSKHKANNLYIWDTECEEFIEEKSFDEVIQSVAFCNNMCFVPQSTYISCISLDNNTSFQIPTMHNPLMIYSVSQMTEFCIASPSIEKGKVHIQWVKYDYTQCPHKYEKSCQVNFVCNNSGIQTLKLTNDGKQIAVASERGTLIRIFCTKTGQPFNEFRRGTTPTKINGLQFSNDTKYLLCFSDNQTVHIYKTLEKYIKSYYQMFYSAIANVRDQWSFAQFNLNEFDNYHIVGAIHEDCIHLINKRGKYLKAFISPQGGILYLQECHIVQTIDQSFID